MEENFYVGKVTLAHKEEIEGIRQRNHHETSSHAFVSLWLWQEQMGLTLYLGEDFYVVKSGLYGANIWFFPCGKEEKKKKFLEEHLEEEDFGLCYLRKEDVDFLDRYFPEKFQVRKAEEASEYIYDREQYTEMAGKRYANIRNKINKFTKNHAVRSERISEENQDTVMELVKKYSENSHSQGYYCLRDEGITAMALPYWKELGLFGILVYVDGVPESMAMGFPLTEDTADGCIEEHNGEISGLSYYTQRAFCFEASEKYQFINGEEDLGLLGLRIMKENMAPIRKNEIYEAFRRTETSLEKKRLI